MQNQEPLLTTYQMGDILLRNRVVMSSLTRCRATNPDLAPTDLHVEYYAQRASAGLILTEGAYISERAIGYINIPGIYSKKQTEAWKRVTDAVHTKNGRIFVQLAHSGSVSHPDFFKGQLPLGPSAINPQEKSFTLLGFKDTLTPAEYTTAQIKETIKEYRLAAENAKTAGFDGLEIHAQNSSLIPQFLSEATNQRTDEYGGSIENRSRLLFEILDAVKGVYPAKQIGVKFTPAGFNRGIIKPDITTVAVFNYILEKLNGYHLAFVELVGPAVDLTGTPLDILKDNYFEHFRNIYKGTIMANLGFTQESGNAIIGKETADLVSFGTAYIANPDLVQRFGQNIPLSKGDPDTYYGGGGAKGFTDYPFATSEAMGRLKGKVALVTGGSRGIGAGIVGKLAQEGASVAFTYVNATEKANKLQNELTVLGGDILSIKADSSQTQEVEHAIQLAVKKFGRIDILVNNAGLYFGGKIDSPDMDMVSIARMWQVNVAGIAHTVRSITPYMLPGSRIISIGSGAAARTPFAGVGDYAATKAALAAYTRSWARDLAEKSITVNLIQPGLIETDLKPNDESLIAEMLQPVALKRFGTPVEIGNVVAFLASDEASYVTGATINVDGGWSA